MLVRDRRRSVSRFSRLAGLAALAAIATLTPAQSYYRRDLPDYDQRRGALGADGSNHCVPTSYVDIFRFMALESGFSSMDKGYDNKYASITSFINRMGNLMDTDPESGTNFDDGVEASIEWIDDHSNQLFYHAVLGPENNWGLQRIRHVAAMGWMARLGISRFYKDGSEWERKGGHAVALAGYDYRTSEKKVIVADPWTGNSDSVHAQSDFTMKARIVENHTINTDDDGEVAHARWKKWTDDGVQWVSFIDKMHIIMPMWGGWVNAPKTTTGPPLLASINGGIVPLPVEPTTFHAVFPDAIKDGKNPVVSEREIELPGPVRDWCIEPGAAAIYVLLEDGTVHHVDLLDKTITSVTTVRGGRKLAVAGKRLELFVLQNGEKTDRLLKIDPETKQQSGIDIAKGVTSIEPDQETRGVAAFQPGAGRILRVDRDLKGAKAQTVEVPDGDGALFLGVGRKGEISVARSGSRTFTRATTGAATRRMAMAQAPKIRSFQSVGKNRFFLQEGDRLITTDGDGKVVPSSFDRFRPTGVFRMAHSWKAYTKADFTGAKWNESPPSPAEPMD